MPGTRNMLVGFCLASIGMTITGVTYAFKPGGHFIIAYGAVFVGGCQLLLGLFEWAAYRLKGPKARAQAHAQATATAILQAMMATSIADGSIDNKEAATVALVYKKLFGATVEAVWVKETAQRMLQSEFDIEAALRDKCSLIDPELRPMVLRAACIVAASDGNVGSKETATLLNIAVALRMSEGSAAHILNETRRSVAS